MQELLILSRAIHFGSCLLLLAVFAIRLLVERPAADDGGPAARRLAMLFLTAAAGSGFLWFWAATAEMSGIGLIESLNLQLFGIVLWQTPPGHVWLARCGIGLLFAGLLCFRWSRWRWISGASLAAAFTASLAWLGHAGAGEHGRRVLMLAVDIVHLLAASLWPAGLLPFALLLRRRVRTGALRTACIEARRFSATSLVTVSFLAASGMANACFLIGSPHALVASTYGRLLLVKLLLFAAAVSLGGWNLLVHKPHLETAPHALGAMARKVWIEAALGALIVVVVAILGTLPPGLFAGG